MDCVRWHCLSLKISIADFLTPDSFLNKTPCGNEYALDGAVYENFRSNSGIHCQCSPTRMVAHGFGAENVAYLEDRL